MFYACREKLTLHPGRGPRNLGGCLILVNKDNQFELWLFDQNICFSVPWEYIHFAHHN